jgi:hypothetical protein
MRLRIRGRFALTVSRRAAASLTNKGTRGEPGASLLPSLSWSSGPQTDVGSTVRTRTFALSAWSLAALPTQERRSRRAGRVDGSLTRQAWLRRSATAGRECRSREKQRSPTTATVLALNSCPNDAAEVWIHTSGRAELIRWRGACVSARQGMDAPGHGSPRSPEGMACRARKRGSVTSAELRVEHLPRATLFTSCGRGDGRPRPSPATHAEPAAAAAGG